MFRSATLKLTGWYAGILMVTSLLFSLLVYQASISELNTRLLHFQNTVDANNATTNTPQDNNLYPIDPNGLIRTQENHEASIALLIRLGYVNLVILVLGTLVSYGLARRTLRPVEEAHEAQVRFVSDASHELRTPLAVMKSELEVSLRDDALTKEELRQTLVSNLEEVESLARMSDMLLAMSRMDHEKLPKQTLDLKLIAAEAVYRFKLPQTRLSLTGKNIKVLGNETSLMELITILIENALKYSPADSTVTVKVTNSGNRALCRISNEGVGISSDKLEHIFERFYRGDESRTDSNQKGFGLGLAIAKQIADMHHGELAATSAPHKTTTFSYYQQKII